jgi:hypothetical protein
MVMGGRIINEIQRETGDDDTITFEIIEKVNEELFNY